MLAKLFEIISGEIDNIIYFFLALFLVAIAILTTPPDWVQGMITGLFAACLIKVRSGSEAPKGVK